MAYDVIVVGAGNAALCAALSAHEGGARVLVLEKAPEEEKGGNSYFTAGGFRFAHEGLDDVRQDILDDLSEAEAEQIDLPSHGRAHFYEQLMKVTRHQSDEDLAWTLIDDRHLAEVGAVARPRRNAKRPGPRRPRPAPRERGR